MIAFSELREKTQSALSRLVLAAALCLFSLGAHALEISRPPLVITAADKDAALAEQSADILEEALREFAPRLVAGEQPIRVVIAESDAAFAHHAGGMARLEVSGIARPWQGLIAVKAPYLVSNPSEYRGTLRHELVHVLLFRNTNTDRMPGWLNEGLCMLLAGEYRWSSSFSVAQMYFGARLIEYRVLDNALSAPESGMQFSDAYAQSLSMTRTLHHTLGDDVFWKVIHGMREVSFADSLRAHGGISPMDFWDDYRHALWWLTFWAALTPGSLLGFAGFLLVITWAVKQRSNRSIVQKWEKEDIEDALYGQGLSTWDEVVEDPDAWKRGGSRNSDP